MKNLVRFLKESWTLWKPKARSEYADKKKLDDPGLDLLSLKARRESRASAMLEGMVFPRVFDTVCMVRRSYSF